MAKQDVIDLINTLSLDVADASEIDVYYNEVIRDIGLTETLVGTAVIDVKADEAIYTLPSGNLRTLEIHHNVTGRLDRTSGRALRSVFGSSWALRRGPVQAFTAYDLSKNQIQLFPIPDNDGTITLIQTEVVVDLPIELELPVALEVLQREFRRESDHQDLEMADGFAGYAQIFFTMIGVSTDAR